MEERVKVKEKGTEIDRERERASDTDNGLWKFKAYFLASCRK